MFEWIMGKVLSSAFLGPIINGLLTAQKQKLDASGSHEARVAELAQREYQLDQRQAEVNASVIIAEQGNWFTRSVRPSLGWVVIVLLTKVIVYDKALGQWTHGHTDPLDPNLWWCVNTIIISYMGGRSAEKIADKLAGVFKKS